MTLIAIRPILHDNTQYWPGDAMPDGDAGAVEAWIECGSAIWQENPPKEQPTARMVTAQPGVFAVTDSGSLDDLAGRITPTPERKKPARRAKKT